MDKFRSRNHKEKEEKDKEKAKRLHEETHANKSVGEETPGKTTGKIVCYDHICWHVCIINV